MLVKYADEKIPDWAVCLIEYSDPGDLTEDDVKTFRSWEDKTRKQAEDYVNGHLADYNLSGPVKVNRIIYDWGNGDENWETQSFTRCPAFGLPCSYVETGIYVDVN